MKIVNAYPPNIEAIKKRFSIKDREVVFTYGNTLYVPSGRTNLPKHLMVHEQTHVEQQLKFGSVEDWWQAYMDDDDFRLIQEVEAYRNQYKHICDTMNRNEKRRFLTILARDLSSPLYGNIITFERAKELIQKND